MSYCNSKNIEIVRGKAVKVLVFGEKYYLKTESLRLVEDKNI